MNEPSPSTPTEAGASTLTIERTYRARIDDLWELWTTKEGLESWWGPEGMRCEVHVIEPHAGGRLHYSHTAVAPAQIAVLTQMGMATSNLVRARFTEMKPHERLCITERVDFVPGVPAYETTIAVDFLPAGDGVRMVVTIQRMHDQRFTRMAMVGLLSQITNLEGRLGRQGSPIQRIVPHLWFSREAQEAARFYVSVFPDSRIDRVTALPADSPSGAAGTVEVVEFTLFGQAFMAISAGPHDAFNDAVSFLVRCSSQAEIDRYWNALLQDGGKPVACGWLIDRFGVRWQVVPSILGELIGAADKAAAKGAMQTLLKQVKVDVAALQSAFVGG